MLVEGLVETELGPQGGDGFSAGVLARDISGGVARKQAQHQEHERYDAEDGRNYSKTFMGKLAGHPCESTFTS